MLAPGASWYRRRAYMRADAGNQRQPTFKGPAVLRSDALEPGQQLLESGPFRSRSLGTPVTRASSFSRSSNACRNAIALEHNG